MDSNPSFGMIFLESWRDKQPQRHATRWIVFKLDDKDVITPIVGSCWSSINCEARGEVGLATIRQQFHIDKMLYALLGKTIGF